MTANEPTPPPVPAKAGTQSQKCGWLPRTLDSRWSLCSGEPKARPEYGNERSGYFFSSARRVQLIALGWHAMPMFEQVDSPVSGRVQVRQPSVHSWQVFSLSP